MSSAAVSSLCATLARYTGKNEIVVGTQVSERDQVELEPMIGQFVNSLILRNNVGGDPPFNELLDRVSGTISEALEHRHIPIERLSHQDDRSTRPQCLICLSPSPPPAPINTPTSPISALSTLTD